MDDYNSYIPTAAAAATTTTTTTSDSDSLQDENAIVLASLLQELSFWEPSTPNSLSLEVDSSQNTGLVLRKSRSVNDTTVNGFHRHHHNNNNHSRNNHQRLPHSISYDESSMNHNGEGIHGRMHSHSNTTMYPQPQNGVSHQDAVDFTTGTLAGNEDSHLTAAVYSNNDESGNNAKITAVAQQPQQLPQPGSPTLAELQERCFWNKAVDPASGRTYYYDIRTRHTQWEKVCC